jgi:hypothetical protein
MPIPLIRLLTFESLKLRHTCCEWHDYAGVCVDRYTCQEEIQEIHDEEESRLELLEDLVYEFEQNYDLEDDLQTFISGYWDARMKEVRGELKSKKLTEDEIRAAEDIGVAWRSSSENNNSEDETVEDETVEDETVEDETVEDETVEDETVDFEVMEANRWVRNKLEYWMRMMDHIAEEPPVPIVTW